MASLAARCTACGTVFRVVPDQLRVAAGLVRCGRCSEVFNAAESLIDLETGAPIDQPAAETSPPATTPAPEPGTDFDLQIAPPAAEDKPGVEETTFTDTAQYDPATSLDEHADRALESADREALQPPAQALVDEAAIDAGLDVDPRAEPDDQPSFVRSAERAQRWRSPRARVGLLVLALLGLLLLGGQVAHSYRDLIAARWPQTLPALQVLCSGLSCRVEPPRSIESLAVESSGLVRVEKSSVYKLQVALRNRAAMAVALPALDLTLSDAQGKPIARRVLRATELGVNMATLAGGRELSLQATLQAATEPVAGYTIELFYP